MYGKIYFNINGKKIYCLHRQAETNSVPILLLHGLGASSDDFSNILSVKEFSEKTILIPDLLGFGKSEKPYKFSYDLIDQAIFINDVIENLGYNKVDIVAHSMGGVIAILFAKNFPEKINRLIVAEPNLIPENAKISIKIKEYGSEEKFKASFIDFIERFNKKDKLASLRYYQTLCQTTYYSLYRSAVSLLKHSELSILQDFLDINVIKVFLKGEKSYHATNDMLINKFQESEIMYYVIPDAGHGMMGDNPEMFYSILNKVLR